MIYLDLGGQGPGLIDPQSAALPLFDRGLLYGDGLFETMLARDGAVPLLPHHLWRLQESAAALGIPVDPDGFAAAVITLVEAAGPGEHAVRLTLTRGVSQQRGYTPPADALPTLLITATPYRRPDRPISLATASLRIWPESLTARHKTLSALEKVAARGEAARAGADEALLLNTHGRVAEASSANLFIRRGSHWITPPVSEGCLPGVMRRRVITLTGARQEALAPEDLLQSDGVYLTSGLAGCLPAAALDGRALPTAGPPPFADLLFRPVR